MAEVVDNSSGDEIALLGLSVITLLNVTKRAAALMIPLGSTVAPEMN